MAREFVVAIQGGSADSRDKITQYVKGRGWGFWHWFDDVWLIAGVPEETTAKELYLHLSSLSKELETVSLLIFSMDKKESRSHWGRSNPDGWEWMRTNWGSPR